MAVTYDLTEPEGASDGLLDANKGSPHSGLDVADLGQPALLLAKYHATLKEFVEAAMDEPVTRTSYRSA